MPDVSKVSPQSQIDKNSAYLSCGSTERWHGEHMFEPLQSKNGLAENKSIKQMSSIHGHLTSVETLKPQDLITASTSKNMMLINKSKKHYKGVRFEGIQDKIPLPKHCVDQSKKAIKRNKRKSHILKKSTGIMLTSNTDHIENGAESDSSSNCSTCSSSSSSNDGFAYQIPQRRHYGGVRVNYVPNDALACAKSSKQKNCEKRGNKNCLIS